MPAIKINHHRLKSHLKKGGVIAYPTESCYGLGALPTSAKGVRLILRIKKRPQHKGLIVIGHDLPQLQTLLRPLSPATQSLLNQTFPAPKTFILPAKRKILPQLRGKKRNKLAVRVPDLFLAQQLCKSLNTPIISTSCNKSGQKPCKDMRTVRRLFGKKVLIVSGKIGKRKCPSEIIDLENGIKLR